MRFRLCTVKDVLAQIRAMQPQVIELLPSKKGGCDVLEYDAMRTFSIVKDAQENDTLMVFCGKKDTGIRNVGDTIFKIATFIGANNAVVWDTHVNGLVIILLNPNRDVIL